jgi:WD40 repeat protein
MRIEEQLQEAYERTPLAEAGAYDRFLRQRARSVRTVTAGATVLVLVLAGLVPRLLAGQERGVVRPPKPVPAARTLIARLTPDRPGRPQGPSSVAFSADGKTLAFGHDHRITVWDVDRRSVIANLDGTEGIDQVAAVAFAPDGSTLAASVYDRVILWDLASRARLASMPMGTFNIAHRLRFSPDGTVLAGGDGGGKLILWDVARRSRLAILSTGIGGINDLAFRADGQRVVVGGSGPGRNGRGDGVAIIDIARRQRLPAFRTPANSGPNTAVAFRPDGTAVAAVGVGGGLPPVGGLRNGVTIWDVNRRSRLVTLATEHQGIGVVLSRGGGLLAVASPAGEVILWDVGRQARLGPLRDFRPSEPLTLNLSPSNGTFTDDGGRLAIPDGTGSILVWSTSNP